MEYKPGKWRSFALPACGVPVTYWSPDGDALITSYSPMYYCNRMSTVGATLIVEVMKIMWLLLFISFGMTGCLLITLAVLDRLDPDRKAAPSEESTIVVIPPKQQNTIAKDTTTQTQSNTSSEPVAADFQI